MSVDPVTNPVKKRSKSWVKLEGGPTLACIDMGTNSFHMIVCEAKPGSDHFEVITKVKEAVPFFRRSLTAHFIDESALTAAVRILRQMCDQASERGATTILAVATSAVRESKNGAEVLNRIREELSIDARMISGQEEARLIYLGVLWSMPDLNEPFAIVDIGGGSTEIIVGDRNSQTFTQSYKLGAARLTQRFFKKGKVTPELIDQLHDEVRGVLRPAAARIAATGGFDVLIGTSGTIQALAKIDRKRQGIKDKNLHGWSLGIDNLKNIVDYIEECSLKGEKIDGVSTDRSQTVLAGSIVLLETMRSLASPRVRVCTAALREGVVVDRFLQTGWLDQGLDNHRDPRSDSVHRLLDKYDCSIDHAEQVARLAKELFLKTRGSLHCYEESVGHLLWSAAMLHDVGTFVGRNGHHKHSYYLIKNGGLLGHSQEEVELIANIARYHRGAFPKESHEAYNLLKPSSRKLVADMAAILRIAEALDRSHRQVVTYVEPQLETKSKGRNLKQELILNLFLKEEEYCRPEIWALSEKKSLFERQFGVKVKVRVKGGLKD